MKSVAVVTAFLLMLAACGGRENADDQSLHRDVVNYKNGA